MTTKFTKEWIKRTREAPKYAGLVLITDYLCLVDEIERLQAENEQFEAILSDFYKACYLADIDGELDGRITGDMMFAAHRALEKESEE